MLQLEGVGHGGDDLVTVHLGGVVHEGLHVGVLLKAVLIKKSIMSKLFIPLVYYEFCGIDTAIMYYFI